MEHMEQLEFLRGIGLFRDLSDEQLGSVQSLVRLDERRAGEIIYKEGEAAEDVCIVIDGQVDLRYEMPSRKATSAHTVATIGRGHVFGWSAHREPATNTTM